MVILHLISQLAFRDIVIFNAKDPSISSDISILECHESEQEVKVLVLHADTLVLVPNTTYDPPSNKEMSPQHRTRSICIELF